ncbi:Mhp366/Mhp367 family surface (lipo)protein [Mesomycoplasma dispar]|uniref:DUF31 domain-containing protein n=1 Tax=Mesomycoplasma dispar TaxID=86660 RepID=A0ABN5DRU7_9BACT|nr:hypothetical protein [Mesomycoplasma dispar]ATP59739.1 hypothetical protein CSW10_02210 [Mesomycoplasma dispar]
MKLKKFFGWLSYLFFLPLAFISCGFFGIDDNIKKPKQTIQIEEKPNNDKKSQNEIQSKIAPENKGDFLELEKKPFSKEAQNSTPEINNFDNPMLKRDDSLSSSSSTESELSNSELENHQKDNSETQQELDKSITENLKNSASQSKSSQIDSEQKKIEIKHLIEKSVLEKSHIDNLPFSVLNSLLPDPKFSYEKPQTFDISNENEFRLANERSINNFNFDYLSEVDNNIKTQNISLENTFGQRIKSFYQPFRIENSSAIKKENDFSFLGEKNEGLNVYLFDKLSQYDISSNYDARYAYHSYFNSNFRRRYFKPNYIGFKSVDYTDQRYKETFQRNIRFTTGTAILLDSKTDESVFLTNKHVLYVENTPFWEKMTYPFMRFYYNEKANDLASLGYSGILSLLWVKSEYDKKITEIQKQKTDSIPRQHYIYIGSATPEIMRKFSVDFHKKYFRVAENFNNHGKDMAIFYFDHGKFRKDIEDVLKFYDQHREWLLNSFRFSNGQTIEKGILDFKEQFKTFSEFWDVVKKFPPLKINEKSWTDGEIDYTTKIGSFWPQFALAKNMFKGVYINNGTPNFFTTNGPGASGSGVFNTKGELVFMNQMILLGKDQKKLYYDQNNLTGHLTTGILFRNNKLDLVSEIKKFYYKDKLEKNSELTKENQNTDSTNISTENSAISNPGAEKN